jgi:hypothetical protein
VVKRLPEILENEGTRSAKVIFIFDPKFIVSGSLERPDSKFWICTITGGRPSVTINPRTRTKIRYETTTEKPRDKGLFIRVIPEKDFTIGSTATTKKRDMNIKPNTGASL